MHLFAKQAYGHRIVGSNPTLSELCHLLGKPTSTNMWLSFRGPDYKLKEPQPANVEECTDVLDKSVHFLILKTEWTLVPLRSLIT